MDRQPAHNTLHGWASLPTTRPPGSPLQLSRSGGSGEDSAAATGLALSDYAQQQHWAWQQQQQQQQQGHTNEVHEAKAGSHSSDSSGNGSVLAEQRGVSPVGFLPPPSPLSGSRLLDAGGLPSPLTTGLAAAANGSPNGGHALAAARTHSFGLLQPAVQPLPLSAHAFPPTVSPEQHASMSAAVAAAHPPSSSSSKSPHAVVSSHYHHPRSPNYGSSSSPPMPMQQNGSARVAPAPHSRYYSPGSTPSSRAALGVDLLAGRSATPPQMGDLSGSSPRQQQQLQQASYGYEGTISPRRGSGTTPAPLSRRGTPRGSVHSTGNFDPTPGTGMLLPIRPASSSSAAAAAGGSTLKRKANSTHSMLDLAPPLPLHSGSNSDEDSDSDGEGGANGDAAASSAAAAAPAAAAPSASTKKGMGRKSRSEVSLTAAERKQNRLKRKAELARVSRRKKKGHLEDTVSRIARLKEEIAAMEAGQPIPSASGSSLAGAGTAAAAAAAAGMISPSASFSNLALSALSPSSSSHSLRGGSMRLSSQQPQAKRPRRESSDMHLNTRRGSDNDSEDEEDDELEDDEDESDASGVVQDDDDQSQTHSAGLPIRGESRLHSSTSAPAHLSQQHMQQQQHQQQQSHHRLHASMHTSPSFSRQHSIGGGSGASTPGAPSAAAVAAAAAAGGMVDDPSFNMAAFLPRVTPCVPIPAGANDLLSASPASAPGGGPVLVQLHRHLQDALKAIDTSMQLDPFEKLLRWVALQASTGPPSAAEQAQQTPAAAAQASAWAFLAQQLDLSAAQVGALRQSRTQTERLGADIAALRHELIRVSAGVRGYMSTLDAAQQQLQVAQLHPVQVEHFHRFVHSNAHWVQTQMHPQMQQPQQTFSPRMHHTHSPVNWQEQQQQQQRMLSMQRQQQPVLPSMYSQQQLQHPPPRASSQPHLHHQIHPAISAPSSAASSHGASPSLRGTFSPPSPPMSLALSSSSHPIYPTGSPLAGPTQVMPSSRNGAGGGAGGGGGGGGSSMDGLDFIEGVIDSPLMASGGAPPLSLQDQLMLSPLGGPAGSPGGSGSGSSRGGGTGRSARVGGPPSSSLPVSSPSLAAVTEMSLGLVPSESHLLDELGGYSSASSSVAAVGGGVGGGGRGGGGPAPLAIGFADTQLVSDSDLFDQP